jgi:hypothetical protein
MTPEEATALRHLKNRNDIVIKPADKGGAVVVWQKSLYLEEAQRHLSDATFYKPLSKDTTHDNGLLVEKSVNREIAMGNLPDGASNLVVPHPRCSRFYLVPKIQKPNTPGRPIVSACSCPTELISLYVDQILQPIVQQLPTFIKDTTHILKLFNNLTLPISSDTHLFTLDVKSLYTVIPNSDGLKALQWFLDQRHSLHPPTSTILRLAELVLTLNCFVFNNKYFQQIGGISMGTRLGPSYACLFLGHMEQKMLDTYQGPKPSHLYRYIDDYIGIAQMNLADLHKFIQYANTYHPSIQLTHLVAPTITFLDCTFTLLDNTIASTIFYKDTDAHAYLDFFSSHPRHARTPFPSPSSYA